MLEVGGGGGGEGGGVLHTCQPSVIRTETPSSNEDYNLYHLKVTSRKKWSIFLVINGYSPLAKHTYPKMFFTARFFNGNVMYMVCGVRKWRMLICILWVICIIKLISIFN